MDLEQIRKKLEESVQDGSLDRYVEKINRQHARYEKVHDWLETHSIEDLFARLNSEHNEQYRDKLYKKGFQPYMNNKAAYLFSCARTYGERIEGPDLELEISPYFPAEIYLYRNYYFVTIHGQGSIHSIYNQNLEIIFDI